MSLAISMFLWLLMGAITSYVAAKRGRDPFIWFAIGILLGLIGLFILVLLPPYTPGSEKKEGDAAISSDQDTGAGSNLVSLVITPAAIPSKYDFVGKDWFYIDENGQQQGSITYHTLKTLWIEKKIETETFVWSEGMPEWKKIGSLTELAQSLNER